MAKSTDVQSWGETDLERMSFQELMDAGVIDIAEIDDVVVVDKAELIDKTFILIDWDVKPSTTYGGMYAICKVKTAEGTRVFADGGSGIIDQLERYKERTGGVMNGKLYFHFGLRASTYMTEIDGALVQASTYYFNNKPRP